MGISNREWLYSLEPSELSAWFDADCSETESINKLTAERDAAYAKNRALKQHIANMQEGRNGWHTKAEKLQAKVTEMTAERNELQEQVDTLKSHHCPHYHVNEHTCDVHETRIAELTAERDKAREESAEMYSYLIKASDEREHYREKCSKMATIIHDALMVMDEGMA